MRTTLLRSSGIWLVPLLCALFSAPTAMGQDLEEVKASGVLRHLGVPYANFVTGSGDGLDVEIVRGFAERLGVRYEFVESDWRRVIGDLTGRHVLPRGDRAELLEPTAIRGDLIANGMTMLRWRKEVLDFSEPTFPCGVWLVARADSELQPITPSGSLDKDIADVKSRLNGRTVLAMANTCLDPKLYGIDDTGAEVRLQPQGRKLNELVPAILNHDAETTLLDVPDALIALERWPGDIKVIGPLSGNQVMGVAFRKDSPRLRQAFNEYLAEIQGSGVFGALVRKYYPTVFLYYAEFFEGSG